MIRFLITTFVLFGTTASWATTLKCSAILSASETSRQGVLKGLTERFIGSADHSPVHVVIAGTQPATWYSFKWVVDVKVAIRTHQLNMEDFDALKPEILKAVEQFEMLPKKSKFVDTNYRFFEQLQEINQLLGAELFPNIHLQHAESDQNLIVKAEQIVKRNEDRLRKLYPTSRHRNTIDFVDYVEKVSAKGQDLLNLISDNLIVTIRRPESARFWIPLTGFQNQRITKSSKGTYDPRRRDQVESALTATPIEEYEKYSNRLQPQYGEVRHNFKTYKLGFTSNSHHYGPDFWIVKQSVIEKRATWTPSDSFMQPKPPGYKQEATRWDQMFMPWSHREFMAPYLMTMFDQGTFSSYMPPPSFLLSDLEGGTRYIESQIWGPVTVHDIEAFIFSVNEPDPAFISELQSHGIQIYDGRKGEFKAYGATHE